MPDVRIDSSEVEALERTFKVIAPRELNKSMRRALSRTRTKTKTETARSIRERYNILQSRAKKDTIVTRPNYSQFSFKAIGRKNPIGLMNFRGRQAPPRQVQTGVSVSVLRRSRKIIKRAFIATGKNGNVQVFTRFDAKGNPLPYRRRTYSKYAGRLRQQIRAIKGPSVSDMMLGADVADHLGGILQDTFSTELDRNLRLLLGR